MANGESIPEQMYVLRDSVGKIVAVSRVPATGYSPSAGDDPAVEAFFHLITPRKSALEESDLSLIRVLEDLIDALIRKDLLRLTDLPDSVQIKLMKRRRLRGSLSSLSLLDNDQDTV